MTVDEMKEFKRLRSLCQTQKEYIKLLSEYLSKAESILSVHSYWQADLEIVDRAAEYRRRIEELNQQPK